MAVRDQLLPGETSGVVPWVWSEDIKREDWATHLFATLEHPKRLHDAFVQENAEKYGGVLVSTVPVGDSCQCTYRFPLPDAVAAQYAKAGA